MEKKKFHETQVGKFLLNKIPGVVSAIAGSTPVGSVIEAIIGGSGMNDQDKQVALEKLKLERAEMDGVTKRSGFWLTSNVRPLILILITISIISGFFLKYDISSLTQLGQVIFSAYFGSRGLEKVFGNKMHK